MIGTIVKPSIGLPLEELGQLVRELAEAGIDFIKDDELIANPPYSPLRERVAVVMDEINRAADRTGKKVMYAFNITDDIDRLGANYDLVRAAGGTCVMVCVNLIGLAGVAYLRERSALPIHGHRAMIGALMRHPELGIDFVAFQKLARLAGCSYRDRVSAWTRDACARCRCLGSGNSFRRCRGTVPSPIRRPPHRQDAGHADGRASRWH
jgi:ribulose-bisphosphate carboxylase large chain